MKYVPQLIGHPALCTGNPDKKVIGKAISQQYKYLWNEAEWKFELEKKKKKKVNSSYKALVDFKCHTSWMRFYSL